MFDCQLQNNYFITKMPQKRRKSVKLLFKEKRKKKGRSSLCKFSSAYKQCTYTACSSKAMRTHSIRAPVFAYHSCMALQPPLFESPKSLLSTCNSVSFVFERDCNTTPPPQKWGLRCENSIVRRGRPSREL